MQRPIEALAMLAEREEIDDDASISTMLESVSVKIDNEERLDGVHFVASNICHMLLRAYFHRQDVKDFIKGSYKEMNKCIEVGDSKRIEEIGQQAYSRLLDLNEHTDV